MTVMDRWTVDDLLDDRHAGRAVRDAHPRGPRRRPRRCSPAPTRPTSSPSSSRASSGIGSTDMVEGRRDARVVAVTSGGTIPDRGLYGVFMVGEAGTPGRRVGELDEEMVYELRAGMHGDVDRPRGQPLAGRGDRPRPGDRQPGAGRSRQAAVLARRRGRPPDRARPGARGLRRARSRPISPAARRAAPRRRPACASATTSTSWPPRTWSPTSRTSARRPAPCRPTGASSSSASATSSATGGSCLLTPFGGRVHAPVGAGARGAARRAARDRRSRRSGRTTGSPSACPTATLRRRRGRCSSRIADEVEDLVVGQRRRVGALRQPVPRERGPRAAPAAPPAGHADAALAAAPAGGGPAGGRAPLRQLPDPRRDLPRVPVGRRSTCRRCARSCAACERREIAVHCGRDGAGDPVRQRRCCSTTSPPTCTRATRRSPSAAPAR